MREKREERGERREERREERGERREERGERREERGERREERGEGEGRERYHINDSLTHRDDLINVSFVDSL